MIDSEAAPLSRTLSEIAATCTKAARGSGCPWGLAEEAGLAARILESFDLPGVTTLAATLDTPRNCSCASSSGSATCGIAAMASLSDRLGMLEVSQTITFGHIAGALMLVAPLWLAARRDGRIYAMSWQDVTIRCGPEGIESNISPRAMTAPICDVSVRVDDAPIAAIAPDWQSRTLSKADWSALERLAAATLVPESEASREKGAGPGDDNT